MIKWKWGWKLVIGGLIITLATPAIGQALQEDNTLGPENSRIIRDVPIRGRTSDRIEGGARRGQNLFHSFQEFDVLQGRGAYFLNPDGVRNIFSRVTGGGRSDILGRLGVIRLNGSLGDANLFFINPNGILFGRTGSLDLNGSFTATTGSGIQFGDRGIFSAVTPDSPSPLLTINPSAFLFSQSSIGTITNLSTAPSRPGSSNPGLLAGIGQNLLLLGGNVETQGGSLISFGGQVEIGSVTGIGTVLLSPDGSLNFPQNLARGNVSFTNNAQVIHVTLDGSTNSPNNIKITAANIDLSDSVFRAGIFAEISDEGSQAGDITLNATDNIRLNYGFLLNEVLENAIGNGGNLNLTARSLSLTNGSQISASTFGQGNAGQVVVDVGDRIALDGRSTNGTPSAMFSDVLETGSGRSNGIQIRTGSLLLTNGARLQASVFSTSGRQGRAGGITIAARDRISADNSRIASDVQTNASGQGGDIQFRTNSFSLSNGAQVSASTFGQGNAGRVEVDANSMMLSGRNGGRSSAIYSTVEEQGIGRGGSIQLRTGSLTITNGARLQTSTEGRGNAGNIEIDARDRVVVDGGNGAFLSTILSGVNPQSQGGQGGDINIRTGILSLTNGGFIAADTFAQGSAGDINISAFDRVVLNGSWRGSPSNISSTIEETGRGQGGSIQIDTGLLSLTNGGRLVINALGQGNAGNLTIDASDRITLNNGDFLSQVAPNAVGQGGNITLRTGSLLMSNDADLSTTTFGQGNAGSVSIEARDRVLLDNSDLFSSVARSAVGSGGNIQIRTGSLHLRNTGQMGANTSGRGNAGNVNVEGRDRVVLEGGNAGFSSTIFSDVQTTGQGQGGNIRIRAGTLSLTAGAQLSASTFGLGNAGSVEVDANQVFLTGQIGIFPSAILSDVQSTGRGQGGMIRIRTNLLSLVDGGFLGVDLYGQGNAGNIDIEARDRILLSDGSIGSRVRTNAIGQGGSIQLRTGELVINRGGQITASTLGRGNAGSIDIFANEQISVQGESGDAPGGIFSSNVRAVGRSGNIRLQTGLLTLSNGAQLSAETSGQGDSGGITVNARDRITLDGGFIFSLVRLGALGSGGNIQIRTGSLSMLNGAQLQAGTEGRGRAGNVSIQARDRIVLEGTGGRVSSSILSDVYQRGVGRGGNIRIQARALSLTNGSQISASTFGQGNAGNVNIQVDRILLDGTRGRFPSAIFADVQSTGNGRGGDIRIQTELLSLRSGAGIQVSTSGRGDAGDVNIQAEQVRLEGASRVSPNTNISSDVNRRGQGSSGDIQIDTNLLSLRNGAFLSSSVKGQGNAADVSIDANRLFLDDGTIFSSVLSTGVGQGGEIRIRAGLLTLTDSGQLNASTSGRGDAGQIFVQADRAVTLEGVDETGRSSGIFTNSAPSATGRGNQIQITTSDLRISNSAVINARTANRQRGGDIQINADTFTATNGGQIVTSTLGEGEAGSIRFNIRDSATFSGRDSTFRQRLNRFPTTTANEGAASGLYANTRSEASGNGGEIRLDATDLNLTAGAMISAQSQGTGTAGNITLNVTRQLNATNSTVATSATRSSGGSIQINTAEFEGTGLVILRDSDITTNSQRNGGNITIQPSGIIAFDDSDIQANSQDARGGNITLGTFFGNSYQPNSPLESNIEGNDRVNITATGQLDNGNITIPNTDLVQNNLGELPQTAFDAAEQLQANSCIIRDPETRLLRLRNRFAITGGGGFPVRPGNANQQRFPTGEVQAIPEESNSSLWQMGDPIVEAQAAYQLPDGRLIISRECPNSAD